MSHENQNPLLQAALAVFAVLAVVLGATTFVFVRKTDEALAAARAETDAAGQLRSMLTAAQEENGELRRFLGVTQAEPLPTVRQQFAQDMETCAAGLTEQDRTYPAALAQLQRTINASHAEVVQCKEEIRRSRRDLEKREAGMEVQIRQYREAAAKAAESLAEAYKLSGEERQRMLRDAEDALQTLIRTQKNGDLAKTQADRKFEDLQDAHKRLKAELAKYKRLLDEYQSAAVSPVPDGEIRRVNYRLKTAWINLGSADGVRQPHSFDVYPPDATRMAPAAKKGEVEVSKVLEAHLAETRIVADKTGDPLLPGDKVHAPPPAAAAKF
jgi:hypothetical protein